MTAGFTPPGDGVTGITSDGSLTVTNPGGPSVTLAAKYGVPVVLPTTRTTSLVTSTLPGVFPYAGAQVYLSTGPIDLEAGVYMSMTSLFLTVTSSNTEYWFDVFGNGQPSETLGIGLAPANQPVGKANARQFAGANVVLTFPVPATFTFDLMVAKGGGTGNVNYSYGQFGLWRLG